MNKRPPVVGGNIKMDLFMMCQKISALLFVLITVPGITIPASAFTDKPVSPSTEVEIGRNATHIARITKDTIVVITGSTYSFTVDTPEDKGLISTNTTATQLPLQLAAKDGSAQQYKLTNQEDITKTEGALVTGDKLVVTAQDGKSSRTYHIVVSPMAVSGELRIQQPAVTINTSSNLTLYFTAGQRSPDATVQIQLPAGIEVTMNNTTVNVIGRGIVLLKDLATQSIGRVGTKYTYSKVGVVGITKATNGGTVLIFSHLDLRPANGADLTIVISNVQLNKAGKYAIKASYTTAKPEVLSSAGTGPEIATLTVSPVIADFARVIDKGLSYKETADTYTKASFTWSVGKNAPAVRLFMFYRLKVIALTLSTVSWVGI